MPSRTSWTSSLGPRPVLALAAALAAVLTLSLLPVTAASSASSASSAAEPTTTTRFDRLAWPDQTMKAGAKRMVRGRITGFKADRRVYLEQLVLAHGWHPMGVDTTDAEGQFAIRVPTSWYHDPIAFRVRVLPSAQATEAISDPAYLEVIAKYRTRGKSSWWKRIEPSRDWRYDGCTVITWRANLLAARPRALADAKKAARRLQRATGITFDYRGRTKHRGQNLKTWPRDTNLVVAFLTPRQSPLKFNGHAGLAGPRQGHYMRDYYGTTLRISRSRVLMNANARLKPGFRGPSQGHVLMHELGHAAGLGHVLGHPGQIMSYKNYDNWQAGDLGGLRAVGKGRGCMLPPQRTSARALPETVELDSATP